MTRKGKIARLPLALREELNERLQNGEQGKSLVQWLNSLPEVKTILDAHFGGQPISENNLSRWANGGYVTWEQSRATREELSSFLEKAGDLKDAARSGLTDRMTLAVSAKIALELNRLDFMPDCEEKSKALRDLIGMLLELRRVEWLGARTGVNQQKYQELARQNREAERQLRQDQEPGMTVEEKDERIRQIMGVD